jgi:ubiquitin carboxyl-terminal hydrolase 9/13
MKIKRLPKVLALHLKRFKFMESVGRFEKLHYRVLYPYHLRLFNTTDDADDPDRLYELYAVVVHIGGGPYHGHYVAIVKTEDKGWLLFDDELVEPVDKSFVRNFFGERPGMACAYVLFYQETTFDAVQREMWADEQAAREAARAAADAARTESAKSKGMNGHARSPTAEYVPQLHPSSSTSALLQKEEQPSPLLPQPPGDGKPTTTSNGNTTKSKKEKKEKAKSEHPHTNQNQNHLQRFTSKSLRNPPKWLGGKEKERIVVDDSTTIPPPVVIVEDPTTVTTNGTPTPATTTVAEEKGKDGHDHELTRKERKPKHRSVFFGLRKKPSSVAFVAES